MKKSIRMKEPTFKSVHRLLKGKGFLETFLNDDKVIWLEKIVIHPSHRGIGSEVLATLIQEADELGWSIQLCADPTDKPGDPNVYDLSRWYAGFDFKIVDLTEDGLMFFREARAAIGVKKILSEKEKHVFVDIKDFSDWFTKLEAGKNIDIPNKKSFFY